MKSTFFVPDCTCEHDESLHDCFGCLVGNADEYELLEEEPCNCMYGRICLE